jgi:predicted MFS family arabinose efflux permease
MRPQAAVDLLKRLVNQTLPKYGLMLGNFATGLCILAPAGMLPILADGLQVGIREAGLLVTYGAVILCFGSPLVAWLTTRIDRRTLLVGSLAFMVIGQAASAFAPNYATVLALRLAMVAGAAAFTPQAASTIALLVPGKERSGAIAFVFLGWSLAVAGGLPLITFAAAYVGWRGAFAAASFAALVPGILLMFALPRELRGPPLSLHSFKVLAGSRKIILLLLITILSISGQLIVFVYLAPLLQKLTGASHEVIGLMFALFGVAGFTGNVIATRVVGRLGGWVTSGLFLAFILTGLSLWSFGAGHLPVMGAGIAFIGLGFAATNSMQQARLVQAAPDLSSASVALNTSGVYIGQAIGSGVGGIMFGLGLLQGIGFVGLAFAVAATAVWGTTRERETALSEQSV